MLNNINFMLCMFLMCTMSSFAISSQGLTAKFDATLLLLIASFYFEGYHVCW